jgi:acyl-CoA dehydrogenase
MANHPSSWEMSTIGHPLSDLCNVLMPFYTATREGTNPHKGFLPRATPGLPDVSQIIQWYMETSPEYDVRPELNWGMSFNMFRNAAICQGIAARRARRQASSEQAKRYADARDPTAEYAWELVQKTKENSSSISPRL